jgi:cytochrome b
MVALHLVAVYVVSRLSRQHLLKQMIDGKPH